MKPVYLNSQMIGVARDWREAEKLFASFAENLFGSLFRDGRAYTAVIQASADHLAACLGVDTPKRVETKKAFCFEGARDRVN